MRNSVLYSLLWSTRDVASLASLARPEFDDSQTMSLAPAEVAANYVLAIPGVAAAGGIFECYGIVGARQSVRARRELVFR